MVRLDQLKRNEKSFTELVFYETDFVRSDNFLDLVTAILMNTTVEAVRFHDCSNTNWSWKQLKLLFAAIARLPKLRMLSLARTNIPLEALAVVIEKAIGLRSLDVWGSKLMGKDSDIQRLAKSMHRSFNLSTIYLKKVVFVDATNLDPFIIACQLELDSLTLEEIQWKPGAVSYSVFKQLESSSLAQLCLRKLPFEDCHIQALGEGLKGSELQHLTISHVRLSCSAVKAIATAMAVNTSLKYLCLYKCNLSDLEAIELAKVLHVNTSLTTLGLSENAIGDDGAIELANALLDIPASSALKVLEIQGNVRIQDRGLEQFLQLAELSTTLEVLKVFPLSRKSCAVTKEQMETQKKINAFMNPIARNGYYKDSQCSWKRPKVWCE